MTDSEKANEEQSGVSPELAIDQKGNFHPGLEKGYSPNLENGAKSGPAERVSKKSEEEDLGRSYGTGEGETGGWLRPSRRYASRSSQCGRPGNFDPKPTEIFAKPGRSYGG
ncbi:hypothetical protein OPV22_030558 [Ensete ventricosum]|uniref:Hyaluronan/mRNA-binding protein domain-containing protein n=1 Tax=Ensete ventricosum TaxID=4639 RepID=A0AAV8QEF0_ENSVE|nr:hypothetical protein OPV22_030558 [Ensete ventricosum]RWW41530.1 hypothetical protein BHE74_00052982 [Ensete ventricosum]